MPKFYINLLRILAFVLAGLALIRPMIDLAAVPSVIALPKDDYAALQYANKSWAWLDLIRLASFISIVGLLIVEREHNRVTWPIRGAFTAQLCILLLYVAFTLPINITTFNWTFFPDSNWAWLRIEWEYARGLSAIIGGISFVLLLLDLIYARFPSTSPTTGPTSPNTHDNPSGSSPANKTNTSHPDSHTPPTGAPPHH
jgi:hypothetical protein